MRAGRMDKLVTLKKKVVTVNDFGEEVTAWFPLVKTGAELSTGTLTIGTMYQITATETDHFGTGLVVHSVFTAAATTALNANNKVKPVTLPAEVWAERRELKGDERWNAQQVVANITCKYRIRYRDDVGPLNMLVDADGREYDIHAALELGRRDGLELLVKARGE